MSGQRVAILDGSHSLFEISMPSSSEKGDIMDEHVCWQPIPGLEGIIMDAVKEAVSISGVAAGNITVVGVGVICDTSIVGLLGRTIHTKVLKQIMDISM
jgi:mediator of RNA polymerase II transcription subunit 14